MIQFKLFITRIINWSIIVERIYNRILDIFRRRVALMWYSFHLPNDRSTLLLQSWFVFRLLWFRLFQWKLSLPLNFYFLWLKRIPCKCKYFFNFFLLQRRLWVNDHKYEIDMGKRHKKQTEIRYEWLEERLVNKYRDNNGGFAWRIKKNNVMVSISDE